MRLFVFCVFDWFIGLLILYFTYHLLHIQKMKLLAIGNLGVILLLIMTGAAEKKNERNFKHFRACFKVQGQEYHDYHYDLHVCDKDTNKTIFILTK